MAASGRRDVLCAADRDGVDDALDALARAYASVNGASGRARAADVLRRMCDASSQPWPGAKALMLQPSAALSYSLHRAALRTDGPCDWTLRAHATADGRPLGERFAQDGRTLRWHLRHRVAPIVAQACNDVQAAISLDESASGQPRAVGALALPRLAVGVLRSWAADVREHGCARDCLTLPPWDMLDHADDLGAKRMTSLGEFCAQLMLLCTTAPPHRAADVNCARLQSWCAQWTARAAALQRAAADAHEDALAA